MIDVVGNNIILLNPISMVIGIRYLIKYRDKYPIKERSPLLSAVCIIGIMVYQESEYILTLK